MLTADCRPDTKCRRGTKCKLQTAKWAQNADWESKEFFRLVCDNMSSDNLPSVPHHFSAVSFHDYLHYFEIFLAHFLMKIDCTIISSLHTVFSLCVRVDWCDVCTDFINVIKVDVDVNEMSLLNIEHGQHSRNNWQLCTWAVLSSF